MSCLIKRLMLFSMMCLLTLSGSYPVRAQGEAKPPDGWSFSTDDRDHPTLQYNDGIKTLFSIGVGRAVGLWIAYPGAPAAEGAATITLKTSAKTWTIKGELTNEHSFTEGAGPVTYILQWDMGLSREKAEFRNLKKVYNAFIDALFASAEIVITTKAGSFTLPRINVKDGRRLMRL